MTNPEQKPDRDGQSATAPATEESASDLLDLLRRERADFLNYKRRVDRERADDRARLQMDMLRRLLPLLDELDRALVQAPSDLQTHPWAQGVTLSHQKLMAALRELGVERVGAEGEHFDPELHEAVFYNTQPDADAPRVTTVTRAGYRLGDQLLRPAQVGVAGPPEPNGAS